MDHSEAIRRIEDHMRIHALKEPRAILINEALDQAIKALIENAGLRLLLDWAIECGFGYDNIPDEYEEYKDDIKDLSYTEGLIYIAVHEAAKRESTSGGVADV